MQCEPFLAPVLNSCLMQRAIPKNETVQRRRGRRTWCCIKMFRTRLKSTFTAVLKVNVIHVQGNSDGPNDGCPLFLAGDVLSGVGGGGGVVCGGII